MAHPDFEEFIAAFNARRVRYLVIGAHALALHARPRATKDLDLFIDPSPANAKRVLRALGDFLGGHPPGYSVADLTDPDIVLQLGVAPVRIDLLSRVLGVRSFRAAWKTRVDARFGKVPAHFIGREQLISAKSASDRPQDRVDVASLRRAEQRDRARRRPS